MKTIAALFLLLVPVSFAVAQQEGTDELPAPDEAKSYTVEVIIFAYAESVGIGTEVFPPDTPEPNAEPGDEAGQTDTGAAPDAAMADAPTADTAPPAVELHVLASDDFTMQDVLDRLQRLDIYRPVMHFGWTQPAYPQADTPPIALRTFGEPPPGLDGSFTLYLSRFLHLVVDLSLEAPVAAAAAEPVVRYGDERERFGAQETRPAIYYRIQENRIVKNGDLRYFDHPKFGVLAKVTRVEDGEKPTVDGSPEALAGLLGQ